MQHVVACVIQRVNLKPKCVNYVVKSCWSDSCINSEQNCHILETHCLHYQGLISNFYLTVRSVALRICSFVGLSGA
jgi:hypothetical protein